MRTREVGIQEIHHKVRPYEVELIRRDYTANGGWETFLAYKDPKQGNHSNHALYIYIYIYIYTYTVEYQE